METKKTFSITTTLPYVNARPHIGFALEILEADVLARFHRLQGEEVFFNTGTDEHGINIYRKALAEEREPQAYVDEMAKHFQNLKELLNLSYTHFVRTTDEKHIRATQVFWRLCEERGDIYKKAYKIKYCSGCELEKTESELDEAGHCLLHPTKEIEIIEEENYFFRWSQYQDDLLRLYAEQPDFVVPAKRLNEIKSFVARGIQDFSISRLKEKLPWGVPVPGDEGHVMYVWFDALVSYISTLGWPEKEGDFTVAWPSLQIAGKDNVRQQAAMWQAMLRSAGLPYSKQVLINGFINIGGQKMSKSLGNIVTPGEMVEKYGVDGTRYLLLSLAHLGEDADFTWEAATEKYNAHLANGLGNLVSRVLKLSESLSTSFQPEVPVMDVTVQKQVEEYRLLEALQSIWEKVSLANKYIDEEKPWELVKSDPAHFSEVIEKLLGEIALIASSLRPFMPETGEKIAEALKEGKTEPLFKRL